MKNISLETGKVEYLLGGKVSVRFNPTDLNYMERVYAAFDELSRIQTRFQTDLEALEEEKEIFALAKETDGKIREVLNALFEKEVCEPLFGNMNLFAYSGGMPVWVNLMLALSHRAEALILDEPTSGLDPFSRNELLNVFLGLKQEGVAVLFSTHIISDVEKCADDIIYISNGGVVAAQPKEDFIRQYSAAGESLEDTMLRLEGGAVHA